MDDVVQNIRVKTKGRAKSRRTPKRVSIKWKKLDELLHEECKSYRWYNITRSAQMKRFPEKYRVGEKKRNNDISTRVGI